MIAEFQQRLRALDWKRPSLLMLVAANLVPIAGVAYWGWQLREVIYLYWAENLVIGMFAVLRILSAGPEDGLQMMPTKVIVAAFFVLHYGAFCYGHGELLGYLFPAEEWQSKGVVAAAFRVLRGHGAQVALAAMALSHGYSFAVNYLGREENVGASVGAQMVQPYKRAFVTHVFLIVGGIFIVDLKSPVGAMLVLVVLKIAFDGFFHLMERKPLAAKAA